MPRQRRKTQENGCDNPTENGVVSRKAAVQNGKMADNNGNPIPGRIVSPSGWKCRLVHHDELPEFLQDNEYLINNHRPPLPSYVECIKSAFRLHTETMNIWTHTLPFFWVVAFAIYQLLRPTEEVDLEHKMAYTPVFVASMFCFGASGCFHTFLCHSDEIHTHFAKIDYCGVISMIILSCSSWLYYGFYCHFYLQAFYITAMVCCGFGSIYIVMHDNFGAPEYRIHRAILFIALGLTCGVPGVNFLILNYQSGLGDYAPWLFAMAGSYISGGVIYAARIPERLKPGLFDVWFHSHQLLHLCVVAGATCCYIGLTKLSSKQLGTCDIFHQAA